LLQWAQELLLLPEHLFIQPEVFGVVFGSFLNPSTRQTMWARHPAYRSPTCWTSLQFSTPKGYGFKVSCQAGLPTSLTITSPI